MASKLRLKSTLPKAGTSSLRKVSRGQTGEGTVRFGALADRGSGRVARNRLESFPQFAGNDNFHLRWVPHQLTDDLRQVRVAKCGGLLRPLEAAQRTLFRHIVTSQAMRAGFTSNTSTRHNGRSLAMKCLKGWTRLSTPLSLCSW
jgi:hypothetical protein